MISQLSHIKELFRSFEDYIKINADLLRLKSVDKSADIVSSIFAFIIIIIAAIFFISLLSIAFCFLIGRLTGSLELGFFIMAALWGIFCVILYATRKVWLKKPAQDTVVKKLME